MKRAWGLSVAWALAATGPVPAAPPAGNYHTYETLTSELQQVAAAYPDLVRLSSIGASVQGRQLWMVKISRNPDLEEDEPEVRYIAGMHGDEVVGKEMCINLIHLLTDRYATDPRIRALVDGNEIWILPSMNPDGTAAGTRYNANGADLNRDFPDQYVDPVDSPAGREPETQAVMAFGYAHSTNLSANFHGGSLVARYPYDAEPGSTQLYNPAPDDAVFVSLARTYANANPEMEASNYDTSWDHGITNGAVWAPLSGGMQDWNYVWRGGRELTLELGFDKWPSSSKLPGYWDDNREAMLAYLERAREGVRGLVRDAVTGAALLATIRVSGYPGAGSATYTDPDAGDYHRILLPGRYDLEITAAGYAGTIVPDVVVGAGPAVRRDVTLEPLHPKLVVTGYEIQDGGDGALAPGESSPASITVRNLGASATGLVAALIPAGWFGTLDRSGVLLPDLPAGGTAAPAGPLPIVRAAIGTPAGHKLGFALAWSSVEGSGVSEPFFIAAGVPACTTVNASGLPLTIADRQTTSSTLSVPAAFELSDVDVYVDIGHPVVSDLHVVVKAPTGAPVALHTRSGGTSGDLIGWYDATMAPFEPLSRLRGISTAGTWTLDVRDGVRPNGGSLRAWGVQACGRPFEAVIPELRFRDVSKTQGGVVLSWWPYPGVASYRVYRSVSSPLPGDFAEITPEDSDATDTAFEDGSAGELTFWLVSGSH